MKFRRIATICISIISLLIIVGYTLQDIFTSNADGGSNKDSIVFLLSTILFYSVIIYLAQHKNLKHPIAVSWVTFILCLSPILLMITGFAIFVSNGGC